MTRDLLFSDLTELQRRVLDAIPCDDERTLSEIAKRVKLKSSEVFDIIRGLRDYVHHSGGHPNTFRRIPNSEVILKRAGQKLHTLIETQCLTHNQDDYYDVEIGSNTLAALLRASKKTRDEIAEACDVYSEAQAAREEDDEE